LYGLGPPDLGAWRQRRQPFAEPGSAGRERKAAGGVNEFDQMYREVILDHYKNPRGHGVLADADAQAEGQNPLCGDEVSIYVAFEEDGETIDEVKFAGRGCAISQAATSMLTEMVQGRTATEIATLDKDELLDEIGIPLTPVRLRCAMLGLTTLKVALHKAKGTPLPEGLAGFDELELS
jgi:nitrogen fixation NifU-like protein